MFQSIFQNNLDQRLVVLLVSQRSFIGIEFFKIISFLGNWQFLLPIIFAVIILLYIKRNRRYIIPFLFTIISAEGVTYLGKIIFNRQRPLLAVLQETDPSFPSGHATIAVAFYGFIAYMLIKLLPGKYKLPIIILTFVIIILIGFSRLYLGVHYFSDVLAGYFVGLVFLIIGIRLKK